MTSLMRQTKKVRTMTVLVLGAGALKEGSKDWKTTVEERIASGKLPIWGYDKAAKTVKGYIAREGDLVLFHAGYQGTGREGLFHTLGRVTGTATGVLGQELARFLWPDNVRLNEEHYWSTVISFEIIGRLSIPKEDVNRLLGYAYGHANGRKNYAWSGPQVLSDDQVATLAVAGILPTP